MKQNLAWKWKCENCSFWWLVIEPLLWLTKLQFLSLGLLNVSASSRIYSSSQPFKRFGGKRQRAANTGTGGLMWAIDPPPELLRFVTVISFPCSLVSFFPGQSLSQARVNNARIKFLMRHITTNSSCLSTQFAPSELFTLHYTNSSSNHLRSTTHSNLIAEYCHSCASTQPS